jgi:nicotinamidase-related amidase
MISSSKEFGAMSGPSKLAYDAWKAGVLSNVDPRRTAVLVIDLQKDFCSHDGALAALGSDVSLSRAVAERIAQFLPSVRRMVGLVAFFRLVYDPDEMSEAQQERLLRDGMPIICNPTDGGADLVITPDQEDWTFVKHRYSAFSNQQFYNLLRERLVTTVAVTGVDTHICVEGTVRHGYDLGYRMLVISDLVATRQSEFARHENSLALCERYFALTIQSGTFLQICQANRKLVAQAATDPPR